MLGHSANVCGLLYAGQRVRRSLGDHIGRNILATSDEMENSVCNTLFMFQNKNIDDSIIDTPD